MTTHHATPQARKIKRSDATVAEQERWIARFTGHFGEPISLAAFRDGSINFRTLYQRAMRQVEDMHAEAGYIQAHAFAGADENY